MSKEAMSIINNVAIQYIKAKNNTNDNLHAFEVVNVEWVLENIIRDTPKLSEAAIMAAKCYVKHGLPFQYDHITGKSERINIRELRAVDQRFGLGFRPMKKDYTRADEIKKGKKNGPNQGKGA